MGATVTNLGPPPTTIMDIGSQFETYSSLADRNQSRSRSRTVDKKILRNKRSYAATTVYAPDGNNYYSGSSTDTSTLYDVFSEDELADDEHDGMNYHLILNQNRHESFAPDEPKMQQSKLFKLISRESLLFSAPAELLVITPSDQPGPNGLPTPEWIQFKEELEKTKDLVNWIPKADPHRELHHDTERLGYHGRIEFIKIGNDLLVRFNVALI